MLDRKLVATNPERVADNLTRRRAPAVYAEHLEELTGQIARRRHAQTETDALRADRNRLSKQVGQLMRTGQRDAATEIRQEVRGIGQRLHTLEAELTALEAREEELLLTLPNLLDPRVPDGDGEAQNVEVHRWGGAPTFSFEVKDHVAVGEGLGILDFQRAAKLSGARFPVYRGLGARLERALINWFLDRAGDNGYTEMIVPYIVNRKTMTGTGQLPKFEHDLFRIAGELNGSDAFLIPTAEVPVTNLHAGEILAGAKLPLRYCAFTPCFRAEAGSYGRDVRGLIRQHQFHKVELVQICTPEEGPAQHAELTRHAEGLLQELGLHYRVMRLSSGDTSFSAAITLDLEVWLPTQGFREISSCSLFTDFQARRMNMRFRPERGGKPRPCHTVNGSGLAVGRTVVAILENYQQPDGSVLIPRVLRPYVGVDRIALSE